VQTSLFYPAIHEFTAYRERFGATSLPRSEHIARAEITIPLFPEMDEATQDRVVSALAEALA
jgi:dTDP-4-amino-4,6-dideoxygalactose transaminase